MLIRRLKMVLQKRSPKTIHIVVCLQILSLCLFFPKSTYRKWNKNRYTEKGVNTNIMYRLAHTEIVQYYLPSYTYITNKKYRSVNFNTTLPYFRHFISSRWSERQIYECDNLLVHLSLNVSKYRFGTCYFSVQN